MPRKKKEGPYLICVNNEAYPASLEVRKVYRSVPDRVAAARKFVRVIDESGEDYLYPGQRFVAAELPVATRRAVLQAA